MAQPGQKEAEIVEDSWTQRFAGSEDLWWARFKLRSGRSIAFAVKATSDATALKKGLETVNFGLVSVAAIADGRPDAGL